MRRSVICIVVLAMAGSILWAPALYPQAKKDVATKLDRVTGTVRSIDKDKSTITVQQKGTTNIIWEVAYGKETKFTYRNAPSSLDEVKEGRSLICVGKLEGKTRLMAAQVDIRDK
jgi:hypothetical protein